MSIEDFGGRALLGWDIATLLKAIRAALAQIPPAGASSDMDWLLFAQHAVRYGKKRSLAAMAFCLELEDERFIPSMDRNLKCKY